MAETTYSIDVTQAILDSVSDGNHAFTVQATDSSGAVVETSSTFQKKNAPVITLDSDLGTQTKTFNVVYSVVDPDADSVTVKGYIDDTLFYSASPEQDTDITINVSSQMVYSIGYGNHTLTLVATDSDESTAEATATFLITSSPVITVLSYLGHYSADFDLEYKVTDKYSTEATVEIYLDNKATSIYNGTVSLNTTIEQPIAIDDISTGSHKFLIYATNDDGVTSYKEATFYRDAEYVDSTGLKVEYLDDAWDSATHPKRLFQQGTDVYDGSTYYTFEDKTPYTQKGEAVTSSLLAIVSHNIQGFSNKTISTESDGTIVEKSDNGVHYIKANSDGSITETWLDNENNTIKKDIFVNTDGTISEVVYK